MGEEGIKEINDFKSLKSFFKFLHWYKYILFNELFNSVEQA